ncbi:MAG: ATP phosphoribosyltransferase regulatory subunit, partial [Leptolyngbyaceae cyanobacterium bins.59]|nr:ATP phosphoribosyltransferase regulatory subunit [Leptolyngbyaceae cyanobacterium bins.59]
IDVAQKRWLENRLQQVFHSWGYHRIITSTLERLDTLMAGGAVERSTVIHLQDLEEEVLGLRPELTASIARTAVTRMAGAPFPQRLYYTANVFRKSPKVSHNRQQEFFQAGVELLGGGGLVADSEILLLVADCMRALGLSQSTDGGVPWYLVLGEAGLTRSLFSSFPEALRQSVRQAIARLDRITLETLPLNPELQHLALLLMDLRGKPGDVLQQVSSLDLDATQRQAVNNLKSLMDLLEETVSPIADETTAKPQIILDLSLVQTFDYYTGIVFEVVSPLATGQRVLAQGGRYDQLLALYHPDGETIPGIGFSFNIEDIHQVLLMGDSLPDRTPTSDWLVVARTPEAFTAAFAKAQTLRDEAPQLRVEMDLSGAISVEAIYEYARQRRISRICWMEAGGTSTIEEVN